MKTKKYLRFGEIPKNGRSINFFKMTNDQIDDFSFCIDAGYIDQAYEYVPENAYEPGVSVFFMDSDGMPVLGNIRRMISLCARIDEPAYIVTGEQVGEGNDGEPLISVTGVEPVQIEKEKLLAIVLDELKAGFKNAFYNAGENFGDNQIFNFCTNNVTEYCFNGWTFTDPVDGFNVGIGRKER